MWHRFNCGFVVVVVSSSHLSFAKEKENWNLLDSMQNKTRWFWCEKCMRNETDGHRKKNQQQNCTVTDTLLCSHYTVLSLLIRSFKNIKPLLSFVYDWMWTTSVFNDCKMKWYLSISQIVLIEAETVRCPCLVKVIVP